MTQPWALRRYFKRVSPTCLALSGIIGPFLISFVCISLFLFLSYMIIEGYSLSQLVEAVREVPVTGAFER